MNKKLIPAVKLVKIKILEAEAARKHIANRCDVIAVVDAVAVNSACFLFSYPSQIN